ncbi:MAG: hypothetical protein PUB72_10100, partial [Ruminococcus sp.]|nr:hypothetical protein [Ruminococcus sp.]
TKYSFHRKAANKNRLLHTSRFLNKKLPGQKTITIRFFCGTTLLDTVFRIHSSLMTKATPSHLLHFSMIRIALQRPFPFSVCIAFPPSATLCGNLENRTYTLSTVSTY